MTDIRDNVLFIRAGSKEAPKGESADSFAVMPPYVEGNLVLRVLREIWFRCHLPFKQIWYNKDVLGFEGKNLLVYDPQITQHYLQWLKDQNKWNVIFYYGNKIGRARHITPDKVPEGIPAWTYDDCDSRKYGLNYNSYSGYDPACCCEKQETEYDLIFIGKDKGRGEFVFRLEREMNEAGLRTFFRVVPETRFEKNKDPRYGPAMPYHEICQLISRTRAILNVGLPGQEGVTIRDSEAIWNNVKLITTNRKTAERKFYDPNKIMVVDEHTVTVDQIKAFLDLPFEPYPRELQETFTTRCWVAEMIGENIVCKEQ